MNVIRTIFCVHRRPTVHVSGEMSRPTFLATAESDLADKPEVVSIQADDRRHLSNASTSLPAEPHNGHMTMLQFENLTTEQKDMLRLSWTHLSPMKEEIGMKIYKMIFDQSPETKMLFKYAQNTPPDKLFQNNEFRFQALRFMQAIESAINMLDKSVEFDLLTANLGGIHAKLNEARGFDPYVWGVFIEASLYNIRKALSKIYEANDVDNLIILWRCILFAIVKRMRVAYFTKVAVRKNNYDNVMTRNVESSPNLPNGLPRQQKPRDPSPTFQ